MYPCAIAVSAISAHKSPVSVFGLKFFDEVGGVRFEVVQVEPVFTEHSLQHLVLSIVIRFAVAVLSEEILRIDVLVIEHVLVVVEQALLVHF